MSKLLKPFDITRTFKLEVGSGSYPQPGYIHCDCDESMPDLHILCKMGEESLPLPDRSVSEILSNHSCEHIPWLLIDKLLLDWNRVLIHGGKLFLRTPDLEFICRMYLEGKMTKEHPVDEANMVRVFGECEVTQWAIIKLFAGQNYKGNFHFYALDYPTLKSVLERYGFERVERLHDQPVFSPGEICAIAYKK